MAAKSKHIGLGRGLSAIFDIEKPEEKKENSYDTPSKNDESINSSSVNELELSRIDPNPGQPRVNFDVIALDELTQSIISLGIIQPITVRESGFGRYTIISGERRYKAAHKAGLVTIPAYVRNVNSDQLLEMAIVENIQREDLNPLEIAISLNRLIEECQITQDKLSEIVGKNRTTISNYIRLLKLSPYIQVAISRSDITMGHAKALLSLVLESNQEGVLNRILKESLSVRQTELIVKLLNEKKDVSQSDKIKEEVELPNSIKLLEAKLHLFLDHKINITRTPKGESRVVINFKNDREIEEVLNKLK